MEWVGVDGASRKGEGRGRRCRRSSGERLVGVARVGEGEGGALVALGRGEREKENVQDAWLGVERCGVRNAELSHREGDDM